MGPRTAAPGLAGTEAQPGEPPALPRRVRGMSDGPRPPVQVARPVLPPSFLERVRAAAEAEQLLEQHTQEQTEKPAEARPEAAMVRLPEPRRPPRFVRSRDWMTRNADKNADKKGQSRVNQTGPEERRRAPGDQPSSAGDGAADGRREPPAAGSPPALPRRKVGESHGPRPPAHVRPPAGIRRAPVDRPPAGRVADFSTEPIPVTGVSPDGERLRPEEAGPGFPSQDGPLVPAVAEAPGLPPDQAGAEPSQAAIQSAPASVQAAATPAEAIAAHAEAGQAPPQQAEGRSGAATETPAGLATPPPQAAAGQDAAGQAAAQEAAAQEIAERSAERRAAARRTAARQAAGRQAAGRQAAGRQAAGGATVQRAAKPLARRSPPGRSHRLVGLAAALVLVVGGVTAGVLVTGREVHHRPLANSSTVSSVVVNRAHAAAWVARQVSPATLVSCDPVTCVVIESHGFPASHVRTLAAGQGNPLVSDLVVATPAVRHQFGAQLTSVYAPGMLATFGSGRQQVDIRVVASHGPVTYRSDLRADLQNRRMSGAGLSGSNRILASVTARNQLAMGEVDSRLMITLAQMASLHSLHLVSFGDGGPDPTMAPFRSAGLSLTGEAEKQALLVFLRAQRPPYQPAHVTTTTEKGQTVLIMQFSAPSPVGLFH